MNSPELLHSQKTRTPPKVFLLLGLSLGYFMVLLDTTVVNVALRAIHQNLGGQLNGLEWVVNAYTIVFAGLLLSAGFFSDRFGAKRIYIWGLVIFLVASGLSAFASSLGVLISMRAILGIGGAALLPASFSLISHIFSDPKERARAIASWASITGIALAAGPVVGGILVDTFGWPSIFLINVPFALISLVITSLFISAPPRQVQRGFDLGGQVTAILAIVALSFGLVEGNTFGWNTPIIIGSFILAFFSIILFFLFEKRGKNPLLPLNLFQNKTISVGMLAGLLINIGFSGILFVLPLFFQQIRNYSAVLTGISLLPMTIMGAFNPILTGRIVGKIGPRIPMTVGFTLTAIGELLQVGANTHSSYILTVISLLIIGIGVSLTIPSLMTAVISATPREQVGVASGALNSIRQVGAVLGVAILGAIVSSSNSFLAGFHLALVLSSGILLAGGILSFIFIEKK